jgi:DNA-binding IclR family transcriptional regulator
VLLITQSIHRVLAILKKVAHHYETGVRLSQLAQELDLHVATAHRMLSIEIGQQRPLGIGAGSLAFLSSLPSDQVELIIKENAERYKIFNRSSDEVRSAVKQSRRLGYGLSVKSVTPDTVGVGVTVTNTNGESIAAISVAGIAKRMQTAKREKIVKLIKAEITKIDRSSLTGDKPK